MSLPLRHVLVGIDQSWGRLARWLFLAVVLGGVTFMGYVFDVFAISGGVVFIPGDAALVGIAVAAVVGYSRDGLLVAWLVTFTSLLGYRAYHAFPGLSYRSFPEQLAYFLHPEGLAVFAVEGLVIGLFPFVFGSLLRWGVDTAFGKVESPETGE